MKANQYFITDTNSLKFNMNLSATNFARSRLQQYLKEAGYLASKTTESKWIFTSYYFEETEQINNTVYVCGNPFAGVTFYEILKSNDRTQAKLALSAVIAATESAIQQNIKLPLCGPVCTLLNKDLTSVLFLPMELLERSLINSGKIEYNSYFGKWINKGLENIDAHRFLLSNYVYYYITGLNAFNENDEEIRTEDYYDCNFIPLEITEECKNSESGKIITFNLSKGSPKGRKAETSIPVPDLNIFEKYSNDSYTSENKNIMRNNFNKKNNRKLKIVRKYRKNLMSVKTALFIGFTAFILLFVYFAGKSPTPDTLGLNSRQVAECAFTGLNHLDIQLFMECMKGNTGKNFQEIIAGFYTSGKMRANYEREAGTLPPNQWFYVANKKGYDYWSFGITNFTLNGTEADSDATYYKHNKNEKVKSLKEENRKILQKGDICKYQAKYYMLHHETLNKLYVDEHTTNIELTYNGKKFYITNLEDTFTPVEFSTYDFNKKLTELLNQNNSVIKCCEKLKEEYPWVPTENEIKKGQEGIRKFFLDKYMIKYDE